MFKTLFSLFQTSNCCKKFIKRNYLYILKLENNKWYVGRTNNLDRRYTEHKNGSGSQWTKIHPVIQLDRYLVCKNNFEEDMIVKQCMSNYGIENVRGGTYSTIKLSDSTVNFLKNEMIHSNNLCYFCGESGHYASNCDKKSDINYIVPFGKYKGKKLEELLIDLKYVQWMRGLYNPHPQMKILLRKIDKI